MGVVTKERDDARDVVMRTTGECERILRELGDTNWSFTELDIADLLNYCEREGLGVLATALSGMHATGDDEFRRNFRRVQMYTNLKNLLTSYEYLLKTIVQNAKLGKGRGSLTPLIQKAMKEENWFPLFKKRRKAGYVSAADTEEFLRKLSQLLGDNELGGSAEGYWSRMFLVTCLSRNFTVHSYPSEDRYYGDLFGKMLEAAINAIIHTWNLAKRNCWV